jgi:multiple sugar transport system substrate-binding protein
VNKHRFKKPVLRALAATAVIGMAIPLAACSSSDSGAGSGSGSSADSVRAEAEYSGPPVEITFWNGWTGGAAPKLVPELVKEFNDSHPNITVTSNAMEWGDIAKKMPLAIKSGNGPDIAVLHGDEVATYAAQGLLLETDEVVEALGYSDADFPEGLMSAGNFGEAQFGVPWSVTPLGLYVNKGVLEEAGLDPETVPTDAESYLAALDALKEKGVQGEWVDGYVFTGTFEFESLLWQFGGDLFNEDVTEATFNSEAGVKALTWMTDLIEKGYSPENVAQDGNINAFIGGKTAFNWNGVWQTTNEALLETDWTAVPVPQIGTEKAVWSSSTHWVFPANKGGDPDKSAAGATFVKWMNDNSADWAKTGELPAQNTVREDPALLETYPALAPFLEQLEYAHYETAAPGITNAVAEVTKAVNEAVLGKKTPQQALDDAAAKATQLLEQNKAQYGG